MTRPLAALLAADVISTTGSQISSLALPWFVLVSTTPARAPLTAKRPDRQS